MHPSPVRLLACLVLPLLTACGAEPSAAMAIAPVRYTCCEARDIDRLHQPGETLTVHWTVVPPAEPGGTRPQVQLTARLTGPFATVADLKAAADGNQSTSGSVTFTAAPVRPSGTPDERPVSTIVIGPDAMPGYYNLVTAMVGDDNNTASGGASIVRIVPRP